MSDSTESRIDEWRTAILRGRTVDATDADELESHLREQIADLEGAGLASDEAFLIAVKRLGQVDTITAEFAREHSDRLWKQLALSRTEDEPRRPFVLMLGFALLAAVLIQAARLISDATDDAWFFRSVSLFVLPMLAAYFAVLRRMPAARAIPLVAVVAALAVLANVFPFAPEADTALLVAIHLPFALWFVVGAAYVGGEVLSHTRRMDFIRFTGEFVIYYALIALGGAVLLALTSLVLAPIAPEIIDDVMLWVLPSGAAGAVIVAAWLVEAKKSVIENLAPVLTAIFTPLFAVMLLVSAVGYSLVGLLPAAEDGGVEVFAREFNRDLLVVFDVLLLVVLGLIVYGISARDSARRAGVMDVIRFVAVVAAIVLDGLVLASMLARVGELGFTPNRVAALGLNVILLVNLAVTAWLIARVLWARQPATHVERWQTAYLPVFAAWVVLVIAVLPPVFAFA